MQRGEGVVATLLSLDVALVSLLHALVLRNRFHHQLHTHTHTHTQTHIYTHTHIDTQVSPPAAARAQNASVGYGNRAVTCERVRISPSAATAREMSAQR